MFVKTFPSDKCCIQSGQISWTSNPTITITLDTPYKDTNYIVFTQTQGTAQDYYVNDIAINNKTTTSFDLIPYTNNRYCVWVSIGYIE